MTETAEWFCRSLKRAVIDATPYHFLIHAFHHILSAIFTLRTTLNHKKVPGETLGNPHRHPLNPLENHACGDGWKPVKIDHFIRNFSPRGRAN
jgi:hypothetical protein